MAPYECPLNHVDDEPNAEKLAGSTRRALDGWDGAVTVKWEVDDRQLIV